MKTLQTEIKMKKRLNCSNFWEIPKCLDAFHYHKVSSKKIKNKGQCQNYMGTAWQPRTKTVKSIKWKQVVLKMMVENDCLPLTSTIFLLQKVWASTLITLKCSFPTEHIWVKWKERIFSIFKILFAILDLMKMFTRTARFFRLDRAD